MPKYTEIRQDHPLSGQEVGEAAPLESAATPNQRSLGSRKLGLIALCLLVGVGAVWTIRKRAATAAAQKTSAISAAGSVPVPVLAGVVVRKDVPIYLDGLGTVQA